MVGPLRWFAQVVSVALFNLRTLPQRVGSSATAMAVFINTPSTPCSMVTQASEAVPTPASTMTGT